MTAENDLAMTSTRLVGVKTKPKSKLINSLEKPSFQIALEKFEHVARNTRKFPVVDLSILN